MSSSTIRGGAFEKTIEQLLRLKGYTVKRNELINGTQIDLVAQKNDLLSNLCFVVECTDRDSAVGVDLVKQKASILLSLADPRYLFRLLYVARLGFTAEAKAFASSQPNVLLITPTDLENQLIDFQPYSDWYTYSYENSTGIFREGRLFKNYVELIARDEKDKPIASLTTEVRHWLSGDNNLLFLLGEYGSGKTSFCRHLIYQLLIEKYQTRVGQDFIPLLINLREHRSGSPNLQQVITDTLINQYGVQLPSFSAFEHVCSSGRVLLVLDGFDEMAEKSDKQTLIDSFNQVYLLASLDAKLILTCRSNFFHSHNDVIDLLKHFSINIPSADTTSPKVVQLDFERHGRLLFVEKLNSDQIREFITNRFGERAEDIYAQINSIHDLSDLSSRPVLLDMILTTLPELSKSEKKINSAALYQHYTDKWTGRDNWRVKVPLAVRQHFSEILAWVMQNMKVQEIDYSVLEQAMARSVEPLAETVDQLETFKNDIQTCSFLVRIGTKDQFRFAHKSFQEFFVARKIITDLLQGLSVTKPKEYVGFLNDDVDYDSRLGFISSIHGSFYPSFVLPSSFTYFYDAVDSRLKTTRGYVTLRDSSVLTHWPHFRSELAVKQHLQEQIRDVLAQRGISDKSGAFGLSTEISTFATEYLENTEVPLIDFIGKLVDKESLTIFCDILRLTQSVGLIERNFDFIKQYVMNGEEELLQISMCAASAKTRSLIDFEFVRDARAALSTEGWSYFLLELASQQGLYNGILKQCYALDDLRTLDKLICVHGLRGQLPDMESSLVTEDLVRSLLQSANEQENLLGITLCYSLNISRRTLTGMLSQVLEKSASNPVRAEAVAVLSSLEGKEIWQLLRALSAKEKDESIKKLLKKAEQRVRTATSQEGNRVNWNQAKSNSAVREKLWQSLRR